jgi:iron complex transport system ATP-binding protein
MDPGKTDAGTMTGMPHAPKQTERPALIDIRNATVWRGNTRVFARFNLRIEQQEQVCVLGPNGSGKTTLLKLLNRELYPVASEDSSVSILGRQDWNVWELRSRIGVVSHDLQARYHTRTSAREVVLSGFLGSIGIHGTLAGRISRQQASRARDIMHELEIERLADAPFGEMSTGEQRRCLLARALIHEPDTLILDEPTAGLDLAASFDWLARMRRLVAGGRNILLVTHLLNEIPPEVERVVLIRSGGIVVDGPKADVLTAGNLQRAYGVPVRLARFDGYWLAYPADAG